jgi:hypothetical protein
MSCAANERPNKERTVYYDTGRMKKKQAELVKTVFGNAKVPVDRSRGIVV